MIIASIVLICKSIWIKVSAKWLNVNDNSITIIIINNNNNNNNNTYYYY